MNDTVEESLTHAGQSGSGQTITLTIPREKLPPALTEAEDTVTITLPQNAIHPYLHNDPPASNQPDYSSANNLSKNSKRVKDPPPISDRFLRSSTSQADN